MTNCVYRVTIMIMIMMMCYWSVVLGWTWHIYKQGLISVEYFWGIESRMSVFFWVLVKDAVFFGEVVK